MKLYQHRNIAKMYTSFLSNDAKDIATIMEICDMDLLQRILQQKQKNQPFPVDTVFDWCCQILCGLRCLHRHYSILKVIHRDIKPQVN